MNLNRRRFVCSLAAISASAATFRALAAKPEPGFLLAIRLEGYEALLAGTVHARLPGTSGLSDGALRRIAATSALYLESDPRNPELPKLLDRYSERNDDLDLTSCVGVRGEGQVLLRMARLGVVASQVRRLQPWFLSLVMPSGKDRDDMQPDGRLSVDAQLLSAPETASMPVRELENPEHVLKLYSQAPLETACKRLADWVGMVDSGTARDYQARVLQAWASSDLPGLAQTVERLSALDNAYSRFYVNEVIDSRSASFSDAILKTMHAQVKPVTFAIGCEHLPRSNGILSRLRAAGATVEAV